MSEIPKGCKEINILTSGLTFRIPEGETLPFQLDRASFNHTWQNREYMAKAIFDETAHSAAEGGIPDNINHLLDQEDSIGGTLRSSLTRAMVELKEGNLALVSNVRLRHEMRRDERIAKGGPFTPHLPALVREGIVRTLDASFIGVVLNAEHPLFDQASQKPKHVDIPGKAVLDVLRALLDAHGELVIKRWTNMLGEYLNQSELDEAIDWVLFAN